MGKKKIYFLIQFFILLIEFAQAGHIWVEDPVLEFQNAKDANNKKKGIIWITFMTQSGLGPDDFIKFSFPENLGTPNALIYDISYNLLNQKLLTSNQGVSQPNGPSAIVLGKNAFYLWNFGIPLQENIWYKIKITFNEKGDLPTTTEKFYKQPITIATVSSSSETNFIFYDENLSAGLIARAAPPEELKTANVSYSSLNYDTRLAYTNEIFIDIETKYDYEGCNFYIYLILSQQQDGAYFEINLDDPDGYQSFSFHTECTNLQNQCAPSQINCVNISFVASYQCQLQKISPLENLTRSILFEHKSAIKGGNPFRIKTFLLNPYFFTDQLGGLYVRAYSRRTKLWYEQKYVQQKFSVQRISINDKTITYFWGLPFRNQDTDESVKNIKCPIGIYVNPRTYDQLYSSWNIHSNPPAEIPFQYIWNKLRIYFEIQTQNFPEGRNYQFKIKINTNSANYIIYQTGSFSTNLPIRPGKQLFCKLDNQNMVIICQNIGDVKKEIVYWFGVIFTLQTDQSDYDSCPFDEGPSPIDQFGKITFQIDREGNGKYGNLDITKNSQGITPIYLTDLNMDLPPLKYAYNGKLANYMSTTAGGYWDSGRLGYQQIISDGNDDDIVLVTDGTQTPDTNFGQLFQKPSATQQEWNIKLPAEGIPYNSANKFKLILLIQASEHQICGGQGDINTNNSVGCDRVNNFQGEQTPTYTNIDSSIPLYNYGAHVVLKIIFNIDQISSYSDSSILLKGIKLKGGFFGGAILNNIAAETLNTCQDATQQYSGNAQEYVNCLSYNSQIDINTQQSNKKYNIIERIVGSIVSSIQTSSYGEITLNCHQTRATDLTLISPNFCANVGPASNSALNTFLPHIVLHEIQFTPNFKGNPLYPNEQVFDFIICFRYQNSQNYLNYPSDFVKGVSEGILGSFGVLQSTIVNLEVVNSKSQFRVSTINWYADNDNSDKIVNDGNSMPTLLRLHGIFDNNDYSEESNSLGLFFDNLAFSFSFYEKNEYGEEVNQVGCGSTSPTIQCFIFGIKYEFPLDAGVKQMTVNIMQTDSNIPIITQDINLLNRVVFKGSFKGDQEFNNYIPLTINQINILLGANSPRNAQIALLKESSTSGSFDLLKRYIIFTQFHKLTWLHGLWKSQQIQANLNSQLSLGTSKYPDFSSGNPIIKSVSPQGFINYKDDILPNKKVNTYGVKIDASTLWGDNIILGDDRRMCANYWPTKAFKTATAQNAFGCNYINYQGAGLSFSISSKGYDIFKEQTSISWPFTQTEFPNNKCIKYSYLFKDSSNIQTRIYMITCPLDGYESSQYSTADPSIQAHMCPTFTIDSDCQTLGDKFQGEAQLDQSFFNTGGVGGLQVFSQSGSQYDDVVSIQTFTSPWNWGKSFDLNSIMSYAWSDRDGNLIAFNSPSQANQWETDSQRLYCAISQIKEGWYKNTYAQMVTFSITLQNVSIILNEDGNGNLNQFRIFEAFTSPMTSNDYQITQCTIQGVSADCTMNSNPGPQSFLTGSQTSFLFTIQANDLANTQSKQLQIAANTQLTINYWLNAKDQSPIGSILHGGIIQAFNEIDSNFYDINDCFSDNIGDSKRVEYSGKSTSIQQLISVNQPYFINQYYQTPSAGARSWFDISWSVQRSFYKFSYFEIDLSWLGTAQSSMKQNLHCMPYSLNKINFQFDTLDMTQLNSIILTPKNQALIYEKLDYTLNNTEFSLRCFGGIIPLTFPQASDKIKVKQKVGVSLISEGASGSFLSPNQFIQIPDTSTKVKLQSKQFNSVGAEAIYNFEVQPSISYEVGARIIIEFSQSIAGNFNKGGIIECYQDTVPLYCDIISERRVQFLINKKLLNSSSSLNKYIFTLKGITQPFSLDKYKKIFFAIDENLDFSNGVSFFTEIYDEIIDSTIPFKILPLLQLDYFKTETKSVFSMNATIKFPKSTISEDQMLFIQFPAYDYTRSFFHGFYPMCQLNRKGDQSQLNFVKNCSYFGGRRISVFLKADTSNIFSDQIYILTIREIPSPFSITTGGNYIDFYLTNKEYQITYSTNVGHYNSSIQKFSRDTKTLLKWESLKIKIQRGVYNGIANITQNDALRFSKSFSYGIAGLNSTSFRMFPKSPRAIAGKSFSYFYIGPEHNVGPGLYQLSFDKIEEDTIIQETYSKIDPIDIIVEPFQCTLQLNERVDVVAGGRSIPIIISFENCLPLENIQIIANISDFSDIQQNFSQIVFPQKQAQFSKNFQIDTNKQIETQILNVYFYIEHLNSSQKAQLDVAKININLYGANNQSFKISNPININIIDPTNSVPSLLSFQAQTFKGRVEFQFECSDIGLFYYALSTQYNQISSLNYLTISKYSLDASFQLSNLQENDKSLTKYGYQDFITIKQSSKVIIKQVASLRNYSAIGICVSLSNKSSQASYLNWTQADNNGQVVILKGNFSLPVPRQTLAQLACAFASHFHYEQKRILTQYADYCIEFRNRILQNITLEVGNQSTVNSTIHTFAVLPDYFSDNDETVVEIRQKVNQNSFINNVQALLLNNALSPSKLNSIDYLSISSQSLNNIPTFQTTNPKQILQTIGNRTTLQFSLDNNSGFIFILVGEEKGQKPSIEQLKLEQTGNGQMGIFFDFAEEKQIVQFELQNIQLCKKYQFWFAVSTVDLSYTGLFSDVYDGQTFATTGCKININFKIKTIPIVTLLFIFLAMNIK